MQPSNFSDLFTECLDRLQAGEPLDKILADYPSQVDDLRPLLEASWAAVTANAQPPAQVLASGMARSRTRFLQAAQQQVKPARSAWQLFPALRLAGALVLALVLIFGGLFATELASAESLPGQPLYGFKRTMEQARLALTSGPAGKLMLEDAYDLRRSIEVVQLVQRGEFQPVSFAGFLHLDESNGWAAAGVSLPLTPAQAVLARDLLERYVEIDAQVRGQEGLSVEDLRLRLYQVSGILQEQHNRYWLVDGLRVYLGDATQVNGVPQVGERIKLTGIRLGENDFYALAATTSTASQPANPTLSGNSGQPREDNSVKSTQAGPTLDDDANNNGDDGQDDSRDDDGNSNGTDDNGRGDDLGKDKGSGDDD